MTAVSVLWGPVSNGFGLGAATTPSSSTLNDAVKSVAAIVMGEKDGTIDRIGFYVSAVTGTPNFNVGLVTLDASGNPTTTPYGGSAVKSVTAWSVGWVWVTLDTPATVATGARFAARIWPNGGANVPSGSHFITIHRSWAIVSNFALPHNQEWVTAWTKSVNYPGVAVRYSDGMVGPIVPIAWTSVLSPSYNTGTTPDERGALFSLPFGVACVGARLYIDPLAGGDATVKLYDTDGATQLRAATLTIAELSGVGSGTVDVYWAAQALSGETNYRLTLLPGTANSIQLGQITAPDADSKNRMPEGSRWQATSRADAGVWTESSLVTPLVGLWLSDITTAGVSTTLFMLSE